MKKIIQMRQTLIDPLYFGGQLAGDSWRLWRILLIAIMGEPLEPDELTEFKALTTREKSPEQPVREFWGICGRRSGKTRAMAVLAAYIGGCCDHRYALAPREVGKVMILAKDRDQAGEAFNKVCGAFESSRALSKLVESETADTLTLKNRVQIRTQAASFRGARGATSLAVIADEISYWHSDESANPDIEILRAVRPGLMTTGGPLIAIGSPYARRGAAFKAFCDHHRPDGNPRIIVARAPTLTLNPTADKDFIAEQYEADPASASAEYGAEFRVDIENFVSREVVDAAIVPGRYEMGAITNSEGQQSYFGFTDPSGGSADSFTLAIAHREADTAILDCIREVRPPFSPDQVVSEFAEVLRAYGLTDVIGDRYSGEFVRELFSSKGIRYAVSEKTKSQIYGDLLPMLNSRRIELLDNKKLIAQLCGLERRTARGGRDSIDHAPGAHDDCINAASGALVGVGVKEDVDVVWARIGERLGGAPGVSYAERFWQAHAQPEIMQVETPADLCGDALEAWMVSWKESHPEHWAKDVQWVDERKML